MTKTGSRKAALAAALALAAGPLGLTPAAKADDWPDHDHRIEQWAAQKLSTKLGDLRGSFDHKTDLASATVHESFDKPKLPVKPTTRIFVVPKRPGETALPPVVANETYPPDVDPVLTGTVNSLPPGVDPIVTGTASSVPPGVDPIITGSNAKPTGAAEEIAPETPQKSEWLRPLSTSMLWRR